MGVQVLVIMDTGVVIVCCDQDQERFDEIYSSFLKTVQELERILAAYLNAIFARKMKTNEALDLISKYVFTAKSSCHSYIFQTDFLPIASVALLFCHFYVCVCVLFCLFKCFAPIPLWPSGMFKAIGTGGRGFEPRPELAVP